MVPHRPCKHYSLETTFDILLVESMPLEPIQRHSYCFVPMEAGDPRGYAEGALGWAADRPTFIIPGGPIIPTRLTAVLRLEDSITCVIRGSCSVINFAV